MKWILFLLAVLFLDLGSTTALTGQDNEQITMTIIYDNTAYNSGLQADHGFSCLIEGMEKTILFDTGTQPDIFLSNLEKLNIDPKSVDFVVISHNHGDHTGGLRSFLEINNRATVYLPASSPKEFVEETGKSCAGVRTEHNPVEICADVHLTGEMGTSIKEQGLILNTSRGLIVITGCAHPGIVGMVQRAQRIMNRNVYLVFGGFHLSATPEAEVEQIIQQFRETGVQKTGPTHCTGAQQIELFRKAYRSDFVPMGAGRILVFTKDGIR